MAKQILLLDDDVHLLRSLQTALESAEREVHVCTNSSGAVDVIETRRIDVVVAETELTGLQAREFLREVRRRCPETVLLVLTVNATLENAVEAMRLGAFDYRVKPVPSAQIVEIVAKAEAHRVLLAPRPLPTPMPVAKVEVPEPGDPMTPPMTLDQAMETPERQALLRALTRHAWNRQATAEELGINRTTLYKKMRKHGLDVGEIGPAGSL